MQNVDRRKFVKLAGETLTAAAASGLIAGTAFADQNEGAASIDDIVWDEEYDVVVVGAGFAGCSAAATVALEGNGKTCLLLETGEVPLGNSRKSGGRFIYTDSANDFLVYLKALFDDEGTVGDDVLRAFAEGAEENYSWMYDVLEAPSSLVAEAPGDYSPTQPGCYPEYPELPNAFATGNLKMGGKDGGSTTGDSDWNASNATHIADWLYQRVIGESGESKFTDWITYSPSSTLVGLVQDPVTKAILGGIYVKEDKEVYVKAGAVIMCCGGFEANAKMRQNYLEMPNAIPVGDPKGNVGIGHDVCTKCGAAMWHMNANPGFGYRVLTTDETSAVSGANVNRGIRVGISGRRFCYDAVGLIVSAPDADIRTAPGLRHEKMNWGGEWMSIPMPKRAYFVCDQAAVDAGALGETPLAEGTAWVADTIEELAAQMDVPADELTLTIQTWNSFCEGGKDLAFYRPEDTLNPVATPPFYACPEVPTFINTDGGPERSAKGEVLDVDGNPIPNLYSSGEFGSVWSRMYQGSCNLGEGAIFGRIAVRNALGIA